jgi:lectin-like protein
VRWFAYVVTGLVAALVVSVVPGCGRIGLDAMPRDAAPDVPIDAIPDTVPPIDPCAPTYTMMIGQSYYRFSPTPASWDVAEHACEADGRGSHLAVFGGSFEMNRVEDIVMGTVIWVGLTDRITDRTFLDVMGEPLPFLPGWEIGDPSLAGPGCVKFNPASRLYHDQDCTLQVAYVCECDGVAAQPSSY